MSTKKNYSTNKNGCWLWQKAKAGKGYGVISFYQRSYYVHRIAYRLLCGDIPNDKNVLHNCDTPACFNPDHLFLGTQRDNVIDMISKGRNVISPRYGTNNNKCKFTFEIVQLMRKDASIGIPKKIIRQTYGISAPQLYRILSGKVRIDK
jgi:hypothetical protein